MNELFFVCAFMTGTKYFRIKKWLTLLLVNGKCCVEYIHIYEVRYNVQHIMFRLLTLNPLV